MYVVKTSWPDALFFLAAAGQKKIDEYLASTPENNTEDTMDKSEHSRLS
jgi:hypothetical protein